jgi:4-alpha-glucanotransferase
MQSFLTSERAGGILAHISSLPGPYGIGDIGSSSFSFIDFLHGAGQKYWQILPTVPTSLFFDSSPYMSSSAFAGSPLLICPDNLVQWGLLKKRDTRDTDQFSPYLTDYRQVDRFKRKLLERCYKAFSPDRDSHFRQFVDRTPWLKDYGLFMCLKEMQDNKPWNDWPDRLARRDPAALTAVEKKYGDRIGYYFFEQYVFFRQWAALRKYAAEKGIRIIGDIPIYVALDSADVWAQQEIFEIDPDSLKPLRVSGVPPDYFSETGQLWGNPLYRWNSGDAATAEALVGWWIRRFKAMFDLVDVARVDHFRGFEAYWAVPAEEETALNGTWERGPGSLFFEKIYRHLGELKIIAEDLGEISAEVIKLRNKLGFPGMKVLHFAFDGNPSNPFLPHNYISPNCVVYTGTHDNDTTLGWFLSSQVGESQRAEIKRFANREMHDTSPIHQDLVYLALSSTASLAVIPLQDLLGFGSDCRMNIPGVAEGNWRWRCPAEFLTDELADDLKELTLRFGRG